MAKKELSEKQVAKLWDGITEADFLNEDFISSADIVEYNKPAMTLFMQNINLFRQLPLEKDGLKPIERRILIMMYKSKSYLNSWKDRRNFRKSTKIVGDVIGIHGHSDSSIYGTLVNNGQYWKNAVPWIEPYGNFANISSSDEYGHMRYTEALVSYYGYSCFFKDLDEDCLEKIVSTTGGDKAEDDEPLALPSRYPNILVNGGFGMASGNLFCIPPFNIKDIIENTKKVLKHPELTSIYMVPDLPTGCDIVDTDGSIRSFCETGKGSIITRATIDIEELKGGDWALKIRNVPWLVDFKSITETLLDLSRKNILQIKDIKDKSDQVVDKHGKVQTILNYWIIIDKAHDPYQFRNRLYKLTQLEKPLSIDFNIVTNELQVDRPSLKGLIQMWIDSRREYKRRLYNKQLGKLNADIALYRILVQLTEGENVNKTMKVIRSHSQDEAIEALMKAQKMNSYQAKRVLSMGLGIFDKNANERFKQILKEKEAKLEEVMGIVHSSKKIDEEISDELDELMEWYTPRKCSLITEENQQIIADTDHTIIITAQNMIKKHAYKQALNGKPLGLGAFKNGDFPKHILPKVNNLDTVTFFDMYGRFTALPVHAIESTTSTMPGMPIYNTTKLNGPIISCMTGFNQESIKYIEEKAQTKLSIVSLSAEGFIKKTPVEEFVNQRNMLNSVYTKVKPNDYLVYTDILMDSSSILIYTEQGDYVFMSAANVPSQSKQGTGLSCISLNDDNQCVGLTAVGNTDTHLVVVTEKGLVKRCEIAYLGTAGKRKASSYICTPEDGDKVVWIGSMEEGLDKTLCVYTRAEYIEIPLEDIPVQARKAKGKKLIALPLGSNLIDIRIQ